MPITISQIAVPLALGVFWVLAIKSRNPFLIIAASALVIAYLAFKLSDLLKIILKIAQP